MLATPAILLPVPSYLVFLRASTLTESPPEPESRSLSVLPHPCVDPRAAGTGLSDLPPCCIPPLPVLAVPALPSGTTYAAVDSHTGTRSARQPAEGQVSSMESSLPPPPPTCSSEDIFLPLHCATTLPPPTLFSLRSPLYPSPLSWPERDRLDRAWRKS